MAFNISRFKSTINKYGGPARPSLFEVTFSKEKETNSSMTGRDITFFCNSVNLPGITIENQTFTGVAQMPQNFPSTISNQPISAIFMLDSDHQVLTFFHNWTQKVLNYSMAEGPYAAITDGDGNLSVPDDVQLPYELGYKNEYSCTMTIKHYSVDSKNKFYEVILKGVYPYNVGDVQLAWESNDQYLSVPIAFSYDSIQYSGDKEGKQIAPSGRGYLETLGNLAGFADVVRQTLVQGRPQSIQDAVNRINRIRNSSNRLDNFFDGG